MVSSAWAQQESRLEMQMDRILDLMDEFNAKGTFFVLGAAVDTWDSALVEPRFLGLMHRKGKQKQKAKP